MKIKYVTFTLVAIVLSNSGFAQSSPSNIESAKTSLPPTFDMNEVKHGPLADFYELVGQYQFSKRETAKTVQKEIAPMSTKSMELIASSKSTIAPKPSAR